MKFKFNNPFVRKTVIVKSDCGVEYRNKVHNGNEVWLYWFGVPFRLKMEDDGSFTIAQEGLRGTGKKYEGWSWRPDDHSTECQNGTF